MRLRDAAHGAGRVDRGLPPIGRELNLETVRNPVSARRCRTVHEIQRKYLCFLGSELVDQHVVRFWLCGVLEFIRDMRVLIEFYFHV